MASRVRNDTNTLTRAPDMVRWGPVVAAVVIGLGFFALLNSLWLGLAYTGGEGGWISGNLNVFVGITAAFSLLLAGLIAGALAGVRGTMAGLVNGVTAWGLLFILSLTAIIPGAINLTSTLGAGLQEGTNAVGGMFGGAGGGVIVESVVWTSFWSMLIGLALAAIGGILGGKMRRPVELPQQQERTPVSDGDARPTGRMDTAYSNGEREAVEVKRPLHERR